jgi:hypothetical protein
VRRLCFRFGWEAQGSLWPYPGITCWTWAGPLGKEVTSLLRHLSGRSSPAQARQQRPLLHLDPTSTFADSAVLSGPSAPPFPVAHPPLLYPAGQSAPTPGFLLAGASASVHPCHRPDPLSVAHRPARRAPYGIGGARAGSASLFDCRLQQTRHSLCGIIV